MAGGAEGALHCPEAPACCRLPCHTCPAFPACLLACCPAALFLTAPPPGSLPPPPSCSPIGHYCSGGAKIACSAGSFNPYLGQSTSGDCILCSSIPANNGYTSNEGEAECNVPSVDIACLDAAEGREYDAASQTCVACPEGTYRPTTDDHMSCVAW